MDRVIKIPAPGFVKLPRALLSEEWTRKPAQVAVFLHLLLSASREPMEWHGIAIKRGQVITSYASLSASCGLTIWAVRNALKGLQEAGAARFSAHISTRSKTERAARLPARGYTLVTICNYDSYEGFSEEGRTLSRTPQNENAARSSARFPATYKEDIRNNIDISSTVEDCSLFTPEGPEATAKPLHITLSAIVTDERYLCIVEDWLAYKRERRETYKSKRGLTQFYNRLVTLSKGDPEAARRLINTAMANNWAGIFPERAAVTSTPRPRPRIDIPSESTGNYESTL